ncbi:uncharacterized protein LOC117338629 [Pecten maximus]|uniref:uncharacterized protein LOC117338629 n=1 Tax=Pecten maximus TaxID=6579 RepID=UPI0014581AC0|nr:uncharacterized protein LOC117338629 [Pecten maximus]
MSIQRNAKRLRISSHRNRWDKSVRAKRLYKFGAHSQNQHMHTVRETTEQIINQYSDVVGDEIGCIPGVYEVKVDKSVKPVAPRPVPAPIRSQLKNELDHLVKCGIIKPVNKPTKWVNSMVGYYHIKLATESSYLTTSNTPFGRYRYLRMPMGTKCSSEVNHFGDLEGTEFVVDDILVHGRTLEEHNARLKAVLEKARQINLKLNKSKCVIGKSEVNYVGHTLTGDGMKPTEQP